MIEIGLKSLMIVFALMGVAAFNIDGIIIHSGLSIPIINDSKHININGKWLKQL